jgi:Domain of unknown function (DUF222)
VSRSRATALLAEAVTLAERLPATLAEVAGGRLGFEQARVLAELVGPVVDAAVRAQVEQRLLGRAAGRTVAQLRAAARRQVLRADAAAAAERAVVAIRDRQVSVHPGDDGLATLSATLPAPLAVACRDALERYAAEVATPDDPRTKQQRMVDCLVDLVLRPGEHGLSAVRAQLTVVAPAATVLGGGEPGEVGGQVVPAAAVRELLHALGLLPRPLAADPPAEEAAPGTRVDRARAARTALGRLLDVRAVSTTALVERPQLALVSELTGQPLALSCAAEARAAVCCGRPDCRERPGACTHPDAACGLGPPPPADGYAPSAALDRFVRARDRRCRFPGCRARPAVGDLDHTVPWPDGPTCCDNLAALCRHHHRLSHQAPGWRLEPTADGGLRWIVPGGHATPTYPPGYGADDDLPPTATPAAAAAGGPGTPAADEPPQFRAEGLHLLGARPRQAPQRSGRPHTSGVTWWRALTGPRVLTVLQAVLAVLGLVLGIAELTTDRRPVVVVCWFLAALVFAWGAAGEWRRLRRGVPGDGAAAVDAELTEPLTTEVDALLERDQFVGAVRLVRERTGLGLQDATQAVALRRDRARP